MLRNLYGVSLLLVGCASPLSEAKASFEQARYPDSVAQYRALEAEARALPPAELFEYSLYRGLSHLALGDAQAAQRWLARAKRLSDAQPELASAAERGRLLSAWRSLGYMPGD